MKVMFLTLSPWKWEGAVLVGGTSEEFKVYAKAYIDADIDIGSHAVGHCYVEYGKPWLLWLKSLKDVPALAHEALHTTCGVLEGRGMKHTSESEEAYTYTMEDLMRQVLSNKKWEAAV